MDRFARLRIEGSPWARWDEDHWRLLDAAPWVGGVDTGEAVKLRGNALLAPVAPTKVIAFARTYPQHAAELGNAVPTEPLMFLKPPSAVIGPEDPIRLPDVGRCDPEGEVAIVIGRRLTDASREQARAAIFGVTALNDVSARLLQKSDGVWARAKGFDSFCPIGPCVVTGLDPDDLAVQTSINGVVRAKGRTSEMVFDVLAQLVWASHVMTLEPGDVVTTGTPPGVTEIHPGDRVEVMVEGVGTLGNPVERRQAP